jgi:hypothetical protein
MKPPILILCIAAVFLTGCVTTIAPDGTKTRRTDANAIGKLVGSALTVWLQSQGVPVNYDMIATEEGKQIVPFKR